MLNVLRIHVIACGLVLLAFGESLLANGCGPAFSPVRVSNIEVDQIPNLAKFFEYDESIPQIAAVEGLRQSVGMSDVARMFRNDEELTGYFAFEIDADGDLARLLEAEVLIHLPKTPRQMTVDAMKADLEAQLRQRKISFIMSAIQASDTEGRRVLTELGFIDISDVVDLDPSYKVWQLTLDSE